ncbi:FtsX-like permease family protein [Streptomyces rubellomurinus]|uniref:Efflux ABC transporter, permease n=1 Tax=Streptomyces rubellomurinus (strain ATCC 31215) TaxID=359131 RepID=A0A0F2TIM6_STRR3|nr:FtsX-like permease family protein [Streptomyces rubellomurinus]KJS62130.1 efflux ABC transporter, permease [Streptomyces rubellomurinus]
MSALGRVVRAGVRRRRTQSVAVGLAALVATTCSVLGGSLLVASRAPFDQAFDGQRGAHLTARFDGARTGADQLAATAHAAGVTAAVGPFRTLTLDPEPTPGEHTPAGAQLPPMAVAGRAEPAGGVDNVQLTEGSWPKRPGEVVVASGYETSAATGDTLRLPGLPGAPVLKIVGFARSVSRTADAWVTPDAIGSLTAPGSTPGYEMLYRFADAGSTAAMDADRAAVAAAAPAGALTGAQSWLAAKEGSDRNTAMFLPFMVAFGLLGLAMSVLVAGNVVAGAVGTATRRIGVLKALGCTPAQVVRAYVAQALIPAAAGILLGVVVGNLLTVPVLATTGHAYGTTASGIAPWVDVAVAGGTLLTVALVAWAAAVRAGRLRTVEALAVGRTSGGTRQVVAARIAALAARLPLPRPIGLGLAQPFARPARAAGMLAAVVFGTAAATFAVGMGGTMSWVQGAKNHDASDVLVHPQRPDLPHGAPGAAGAAAPPARPVAADPAAVTAALTAQPGTAAYYGLGAVDVTVPGVAGNTTVTAFVGNSGWAGYRMVSGRWYQGPGEAVAPATFLTEARVGLGDRVTFTDHGRPVTVRIVGEVFDPHMQTNELFTDAATFPAGTAPSPDLWFVKLDPGTDHAAYATALGAALAPLHMTAEADARHSSSGSIAALNSLTATLTLLLVVVAGLGVFNTVVLEIRERTRDMGVTKALGMTPAQTVGVVLASVLLVGAVGGAIGLPLGLLLHGRTVPAMGHSAGLNFPDSALDVFGTPLLLLLALGGLLIALLGALLPAVRAARARTVEALRAE